MKSIKLGLILAAYAVASCFCLALVNNITAPVIAARQADKVGATLKVVFKDADSFEAVTDFTPEVTTTSIDEFYIAKKADKVVGAVVKATGPTFEKATILVGQDLNGTVTGLRFLELSDSPGFGQKAQEDTYKTSAGTTFYEQFTGKDAKAGFTAGSTYEAISGATVTSKGVGVILTDASKTAGNYLEAKHGGKSVK